jgi:hypothetical protein
MANANQQNKNRLIVVGGTAYTSQANCPIPSGSVGEWRDGSGTMKRRNADGSDTVLGGVNAPQVLQVDLVAASALASNVYANGTSGVGATLTASANGALANIDGVAVTAGMVLLVTAESAAANNGVYTVTSAGAAGSKYVLTRLAAFDESSEMKDGTLFVVAQGTLNGDTTWKFTTTSAPTVGTTSLSFSRDPGVLTTNSAQTVTGAKTFADGTLKANNSGGTFATVIKTAATAARTATLADVDGTIPVSAQGTPSGLTTVTSAGSGTALKADTTTTGGTGSTAYTFADVVAALKASGALKA